MKKVLIGLSGMLLTFTGSVFSQAPSFPGDNQVRVNTAAPSNLSSPVNLIRGAELFVDVTGPGKIRIHLKKYSHNTKDNNDTGETVALQELDVQRDPVLINLKKEVDSIIPNLNSDHEGDAQVLRMTEYIGDADMGLMYARYLVTWGYCISNTPIQNFAANAESGQLRIALAVPVDNMGQMKIAESPPLIRLPLYKLKSGESYEAQLKVARQANVTHLFELVHPLSSMSAAGKNYSDLKATTNYTIDSDPSYLSYTGSLIPGQAPFAKLKYSQGYSAANPLKAEKFKFHHDTGNISFKAPAAGKYLLALKILTKSGDSIVPDHVAFFFIDIK